ncbi:MAG: hypothetical protein AAFU61_01935, partial [Pseudomonadota bacterium]
MRMTGWAALAVAAASLATPAEAVVLRTSALSIDKPNDADCGPVSSSLEPTKNLAENALVLDQPGCGGAVGSASFVAVDKLDEGAIGATAATSAEAGIDAEATGSVGLLTRFSIEESKTSKKKKKTKGEPEDSQDAAKKEKEAQKKTDAASADGDKDATKSTGSAQEAPESAASVKEEAEAPSEPPQPASGTAVMRIALDGVVAWDDQRAAGSGLLKVVFGGRSISHDLFTLTPSVHGGSASAKACRQQNAATAPGTILTPTIEAAGVDPTGPNFTSGFVQQDCLSSTATAGTQQLTDRTYDFMFDYTIGDSIDMSVFLDLTAQNGATADLSNTAEISFLLDPGTTLISDDGLLDN